MSTFVSIARITACSWFEPRTLLHLRTAKLVRAELRLVDSSRFEHGRLKWRNWQTHGTQKPKQRIARG
jgi:hypothetical protein